MLFSFCCCHGDGSDGRHVCSKYHGHTHYYQATIYKLDAESRKLRAAEGVLGCSVPSAVRTLLRAPEAL